MSKKKAVKVHKPKTDPRAKAGEVIYTDGKDRNEEKIEATRKLESLLGVGLFNPYGTTIEEDFERNLKELTLGELQNLAIRAGFSGAFQRPRLLEMLRKDFKRFGGKDGISGASSVPRKILGAREIDRIYEGDK